MAMEHEQPSAKFLTSREYWTTIIDSSTTSESEGVIEDFIRVPRFEKHKVQLLEQIAEGAQGKIHTAQVYVHNNHLNEDEQLPVQCVVKVFKKGGYGQWPEKVFELSKLFKNICGFLGYLIEKDKEVGGETFYLIMNRYDGSLRGAIDKQMKMKKRDLKFRVAFALFYLLFMFYAPTVLGHLENYIPANPTSSLAHVMPEWYFLPNYAILQSFVLLGGVAAIRLVFVSLFAYYKPLAEERFMFMMIHIALGMRVLHEKKILHRDLKADNVFVECEKTKGLPIAACIGDFDVGSKVIGTLFWRAPEILQAVKDKKSIHEIEFEPAADVYSYAMTWYEILTGGIPLKELRRTDYDAVLSGKRPKLPSDLNPKVKALIERCWHQDPAMRPTFGDVVTELEELVKELVTGSQDISEIFNDMFDGAKTSLDIARASAESNLGELKDTLQVLVVKYNRADFLLLGLGIVAAMEEFQSKFGLRSFKEQHDLQYSDWFARRKLFDTILWKRGIFARLCAYIIELGKINALLENVIDTISEDNCHEESLYTDEASATEAEIARRNKEWEGYLLEVQGRMQNPPSFQHSTCVRKLANPNSQDKFQACDLCKFKGGASDEGNVKYRLYVRNNQLAFTKLATLISSSLRTIIDVLFPQYLKVITSRIWFLDLHRMQFSSKLARSSWLLYFIIYQILDAYGQILDAYEADSSIAPSYGILLPSAIASYIKLRVSIAYSLQAD